VVAIFATIFIFVKFLNFHSWAATPLLLLKSSTDIIKISANYFSWG
jgi:hypothetical protein